MKNVIVVWCSSHEREFEAKVPLLFLGKRNKAHGFLGDIHVVFLDGFDRLSEEYKCSLLDVGFILYDVHKVFVEFERQYQALDRFGLYEKKCFLRWLVLEKLFAGEPIIHYDGDIVFNEDPTVIAKKLVGKTFVLQGCPAFTVVSNQGWYEQYKAQLKDFINDVDAYSEYAWKQRVGWEVTFKTRWAGSRFRKVITSDQDFLSHLIHTGNIYQDTVESVMLCLQDYIYFDNPLFIHLYDENFPFTYVREDDIDYFLCERQDGEKCFYKKRVLFWHMQSCFNYYLSKFLLRKFLYMPGRIPLTLSSTTYEDRLNKLINRFTGHISRESTYKYFFQKSDFGGIFKSRIWWKQGVFK